MAEPLNPRVRAALLEIVETQLRDGTPPETRATLDRLIAAGYTRERAMELIACVVLVEANDVLKTRQPFDEARYANALHALPRLPGGDE
jgi:hypothetical protein